MPKTILVVDDAKSLRTLVSIILPVSLPDYAARPVVQVFLFDTVWAYLEARALWRVVFASALRRLRLTRPTRKEA